MERLDPAGRSTYSASNRSRKGKSKKDIEHLSFSSFLETSTDTEASNELGITSELGKDYSLEQILDQIYEIGEKVKENASFEEVKKYKAAVRSFMQRVVRYGLELEERTSSPNIIRQKKFTLIKVIDKKLEQLASGVLSNQRDTLEILGKIDEINGLLVDLIS